MEFNFTTYDNYCKERGIDPAQARKAMTMDQALVINEFEAKWPEMQKQIAEWDTKAKQMQTEKEVKKLLSLFVQKNVPVSKFKDEFKTFHDGWSISVGNAMYERAEWEILEDGSVNLKGRKKPTAEQPKNELEKILEFSKIDFSEDELTMGEILKSAVNANAGNRLVK